VLGRALVQVSTGDAYLTRNINEDRCGVRRFIDWSSQSYTGQWASIEQVCESPKTSPGKGK